MQQKWKESWFDKDCETARTKSFQKLNNWREENDALLKALKKEEYIECNKQYNKLIQFKKLTFYENLRIKLNSITDS